MNTVKPVRYLDGAEAAKVVGVKAQTWRAWRVQGKTPPPDVMIGSQPGWLRHTVENAPLPKGRGRARR